METYIFLDESGDLGFNFQRQTSRYFTITLLVVHGKDNARKLRKATEKTLKRKLNPKPTKRTIHELKATNTTLPIKQYFYEQVREIPFNICSRTLDKLRYQGNFSSKEELYNFLTYQALTDVFDMYNNHNLIQLTLDKSKNKLGIEMFDEFIISSFPQYSFNITHVRSQKEYALQVCDMFCGGVFRKYEKGEVEWFNYFAQDGIIYDIECSKK